jgi:hypothetical protein
MGKRGPAPQGEYGGKTAVFSTRMRPDTRARLTRAAKASRRSLTQEMEHRLRGSFAEDDKAVEFFGSVQNAAICRLIGVVIQTASTTSFTKTATGWVPDLKNPAEWLSDPKLFDHVFTGIMHALLWFRPGGAGGPQEFSYSSDVEALLAEIRAADPAAPLATRSTREHAMARLRDGLGELATRPHPHDEWRKSEPEVRIVLPKRRKK